MKRHIQQERVGKYEPYLARLFAKLAPTLVMRLNSTISAFFTMPLEVRNSLEMHHIPP